MTEKYVRAVRPDVRPILDGLLVGTEAPPLVGVAIHKKGINNG